MSGFFRGGLRYGFWVSKLVSVLRIRMGEKGFSLKFEVGRVLYMPSNSYSEALAPFPKVSVMRGWRSPCETALLFKESAGFMSSFCFRTYSFTSWIWSNALRPLLLKEVSLELLMVWGEETPPKSGSRAGGGRDLACSAEPLLSASGPNENPPFILFEFKCFPPNPICFKLSCKSA